MGIMKNYTIGFSVRGCLSFILILIPNIIWVVFPPAHDVLLANNAPFLVLDIISDVCRWATTFLLVLLVHKSREETPLTKKTLLAAAACLIGYYTSWMLYFTGNVNPWLLVLGLCVLPSLFFVFIAIRLKNYPALVPIIIFAIVHIITASINYF
jgi:hypothetical protein